MPRSVWPLFAKVLSTELYHGYKSGLWGFVIKSLISSRLQRWQNGELIYLWQEAQLETTPSNSNLDSSAIRKSMMPEASTRWPFCWRNALSDIPRLCFLQRWRCCTRSPSSSSSNCSAITLDGQSITALKAFPLWYKSGCNSFTSTTSPRHCDWIRCSFCSAMSWPTD